MSQEYNGWRLELNYGRRDSDGNAGLWEWGYHDPRTGQLVFSGVLSGYKPPEQSPDEFMEEKQSLKQKAKVK